MGRKRRIVAVFTFSDKVLQFIGDVQALIESLTTAPGNTKVTIPPATLTLVTGHIGDLVAAQATAESREDGTAADRDIAWDILETDVRDLVFIVQAAANLAADETEAIAIIQACGLRVKNKGVFVKADIEVRVDADVQGLVHLISKAADRKFRAAYEWQYSANNVAFSPLKITTKSRTTWLSGLQPGNKVYVRKRVIIGDMPGPPNWSQVVSVYII
jgi:hypothetical protein